MPDVARREWVGRLSHQHEDTLDATGELLLFVLQRALRLQKRRPPPPRSVLGLQLLERLLAFRRIVLTVAILRRRRRGHVAALPHCEACPRARMHRTINTLDTATDNRLASAVAVAWLCMARAPQW